MAQSVNGVNHRIRIMILGSFYSTSYKIIP